MVYRQVIVLIKRTIFLIFLLFCFCGIVVSAREAPAVSAASAVLYDPLSKRVLYDKNAEEPRGMASTTKIMTAIVALEQYDLSHKITIKKEWCGIEGSSMYLKQGEQITVLDLLYGLLLASGNDAATALAGAHRQGTEAFVAAMNRKAVALGLKNTHFDNPSGLDGKTHYTTALELAKLSAYAMEHPVFAQIVQTKDTTVAGHVLSNHNRLLRDINASGIKTGYTKACGRCLVSAKEQNGRLLICVTLHAPDDWKDHKKLYEYGFSKYAVREVLGAGDCGSCPLIGSEKGTSRLYCNESFSVFCNEEDAISVSLCGPRFVYGAISAGAPYGSIQVWIEDQLLFETPVYFAQNSTETEQKIPIFTRWMNYIFRR